MKRGMLLLTSSLILSTHLHAEHNRIGDQWRASQEYQHYLELEKQGKSKEASKIKEETITALTHEVLKDFIQSFEEKYQEKKAKEVDALPIGLQGLLADIDMQVKEKLNSSHTPRDISKIKNYMINYVESIYKDKGRCIKSVESILQLAPELKDTKIAQFLLEIGGNYDDSAKAKEDSAKAKEESAKAKEESAKAKEESEAWRKIGEILKAIE